MITLPLSTQCWNSTWYSSQPVQLLKWTLLAVKNKNHTNIRWRISRDAKRSNRLDRSAATLSKHLYFQQIIRVETSPIWFPWLSLLSFQYLFYLTWIHIDAFNERLFVGVLCIIDPCADNLTVRASSLHPIAQELTSKMIEHSGTNGIHTGKSLLSSRCCWLLRTTGEGFCVEQWTRNKVHSVRIQDSFEKSHVDSHNQFIVTGSPLLLLIKIPPSVDWCLIVASANLWMSWQNVLWIHS